MIRSYPSQDGGGKKKNKNLHKNNTYYTPKPNWGKIYCGVVAYYEWILAQLVELVGAPWGQGNKNNNKWHNENSPEES